MFEEVILYDFRMLAGNHGNDTKSARKVDNVCDAQLVTSIICKHEQICGCRVTKLSVCAKSCWQVGSRMTLTLGHIASQLQSCANCSRATSSDTYGSGKRMVRGMAKFVCAFGEELQSAFGLPRRSVSGSSWSLVRARLRVAGNACRGVQLIAFLTVVVIRVSAK